MCFEWDKRYFREQAELKAKQKVDELIKNAEESVRVNQADNAFEAAATQISDYEEKVVS
jgi:hypothetical protein